MYNDEKKWRCRKQVKSDGEKNCTKSDCIDKCVDKWQQSKTSSCLVPMSAHPCTVCYRPRLRWGGGAWVFVLNVELFLLCIVSCIIILYVVVTTVRFVFSALGSTYVRQCVRLPPHFTLCFITSLIMPSERWKTIASPWLLELYPKI